MTATDRTVVIGIEGREDYCEAAARRLDQLTLEAS